MSFHLHITLFVSLFLFAFCCLSSSAFVHFILITCRRRVWLFVDSHFCSLFLVVHLHVTLLHDVFDYICRFSLVFFCSRSCSFIMYSLFHVMTWRCQYNHIVVHYFLFVAFWFVCGSVAFYFVYATVNGVPCFFCIDLHMQVFSRDLWSRKLFFRVCSIW